MKKHVIIPIFLPHKGCPNDCVFCNQKKITAKLKPFEKEDVIARIEEYLPTIIGRNLETVEIAFFGGSFTGIPMEQQSEYLEIAKSYKDKGLINRIRLSTRPDYINLEILENLKKYGVDTIELGVQSFDKEVLEKSNRGHNSEIVYKSAELIKSFGFELGIQLMIGLPGDNYEKAINSTLEAIKIKPAIARIYPTIVISDTELEKMYLEGKYEPLTLEYAIKATKDMYLLLKNAGINVIRIGLKSSDFIKEGKDAKGGSYHPAFRQLVESEIIKDIIEEKLNDSFKTAYCYSIKKNFSNMIGNKKSNKEYFTNKYKGKEFIFKVDENLEDEEYIVKLI